MMAVDSGHVAPGEVSEVRGVPGDRVHEERGGGEAGHEGEGLLQGGGHHAEHLPLPRHRVAAVLEQGHVDLPPQLPQAGSDLLLFTCRQQDV